MSWTTDVLVEILNEVKLTRNTVRLQGQALALINRKLDTALLGIHNINANLPGEIQAIQTSLQTLIEGEENDLATLLQKIEKELQPNPAVTFVATVTNPNEELTMTALKGKLKATADLQVQDNGTILIAINAVDSVGELTAWPSGAPAPSVSEVDPSGGPFFTLADPVATATGFTVAGSVNAASLTQGAPLPTGIQFNVIVASGFPNQTGPETIPATPAVDLVPGPANSVVAGVSGQ